MTTRRARRTYTDEFKNQLLQLYLNSQRKCNKQLEMENDILKQAALILG